MIVRQENHESVKKVKRVARMRMYLIPFVVMCLSLIVFILLWRSLENEAELATRKTVQANAMEIKHTIKQTLNQRIAALEHLGAMWTKQKRLNEAEWQQNAKLITQHFPGFQAIEWANAKFIVKLIEPVKGNERALGLNLAFEKSRQEALLKAKKQFKIISSNPISLVQGGMGFLTFVPVKVNNQFDGFVLGVFRVDQLIPAILTSSVLKYSQIQISINGQTLFDNKQKGVSKWEQHVKFNFYSEKWRITATPTAEYIARYSSHLPMIILIAGIAFSIALYFALLLLFKASAREKRFRSEVNKREKSEELANILMENSPNAVLIVDKDARIIYINAQLTVLLGYKSEELLGKPVEILVPKKIRKRHVALRNSYLKNPGFIRFADRTDLYAVAKNNHRLPVELELAPITIHNEPCALCTLVDLSHLRRYEKSLKTQKKSIQLIHDVTTAAAEETQLDHVIQLTLNLVSKSKSWPIAHAYFPNKDKTFLIPSELWYLKDEASAARFKTVTMNSPFKHYEGLPGRVWSLKKPLWIYDVTTDENFPRAHLGVEIEVKGAVGLPVTVNGEVVAILEFFDYRPRHAISEQLQTFEVLGEQLGRVIERSEASKNLEALAHYDTITKLSNRAHFMDLLRAAIQQSREKNAIFALLYMDIDGFKKLNDNYGHAFGDAFLHEIAKRLKSIIAHKGTVSRIGGDEFCVLLTDIQTPDDAKSIAETILSNLKQKTEIKKREIHTISTSIGIAFFPDNGRTATKLMRNADMAMYHAKAVGRGTYQLFSKSLDDDRRRRAAIEEQLRIALKHDEFFLVYQPQICIKTKKIIGVEALIRWNSPVLGMVPPNEFIEIAESSGSIYDIGEWVFKTACHHFKSWDNLINDDFVISINFSALQLTAEYFGRAQAVLNNSGVDTHRIVVEVTETAIMEHFDETTAVLQLVREMGMLVAVDDFGTGYSSLNYLKNLPIDILKVDQTFSRDVCDDENDAAIVETILQLAKSLGLETIAEGVEEESQLNFFEAHDCDNVQGYFFSKPLAEAELLEYIKTHS
jgi:diguanylate cyclase (GGDEF)-like protein/PAS domain S-box-containing protein